MFDWNHDGKEDMWDYILAEEDRKRYENLKNRYNDDDDYDGDDDDDYDGDDDYNDNDDDNDDDFGYYGMYNRSNYYYSDFKSPKEKAQEELVCKIGIFLVIVGVIYVIYCFAKPEKCNHIGCNNDCYEDSKYCYEHLWDSVRDLN